MPPAPGSRRARVAACPLPARPSPRGSRSLGKPLSRSAPRAAGSGLSVQPRRPLAPALAVARAAGRPQRPLLSARRARGEGASREAGARGGGGAKAPGARPARAPGGQRPQERDPGIREAVPGAAPPPRARRPRPGPPAARDAQPAPRRPSPSPRRGLRGERVAGEGGGCGQGRGAAFASEPRRAHGAAALLRPDRAMGKEQELVQAVKAEDVGAAQRLLQRPRPGKASECWGRRGRGAPGADSGGESPAFAAQGGERCCRSPGAGRGQQRPDPGSAPPRPTAEGGRPRARSRYASPQRAPGGTHLPVRGVHLPPSLFMPGRGLTARGLCWALKGRVGCPPPWREGGSLAVSGDHRAASPGQTSSPPHV